MKGQSDPEIQKNIIKMSLDNDEDGFVYFNDLLFKSMRLQYGDEHVRNRLLADSEIKALKKIKKIREKKSKERRSTEKKDNASVNPFLTMMYYNMSFKAWRTRWNTNIERRKNEQAYDLSRDSSDMEDEENEVVQDRDDYWEDIEYEEFNPEDEAFTKQQLILQGIQEKPISIENSDDYHERPAHIPLSQLNDSSDAILQSSKNLLPIDPLYDGERERRPSLFKKSERSNIFDQSEDELLASSRHEENFE